MTLETLRFGELEIEENEVIQFKEGLPGLEHLHKFILINNEESEPIRWMQSVDDGNIVLPVINPFIIMDDFELEVNDSEIEFLELWEMQDLLIVCVVLIPEKIEEMTANFAAPILINTKTGYAKQVLVDRKTYSIKHPIFEAVYQYIERSMNNVSALSQS